MSDLAPFDPPPASAARAKFPKISLELSLELSIRNLRKRFEGRAVLDGVNLDVPRGSVFCILGRSGTGKSVLLKCIMNIVSADGGEILHRGYDLANQKHAKENRLALKDFGYLFQDAALFDFMTVEENIGFALREVKKMTDGKAMRTRIAELLEWIELPGIEKRMPSELSGGMRKRVGLARTLAAEPSVMLCDEPTTGLDPVTGNSIMQLLKKTNERLGVTCIIITHDLSTAFRISDYFALLDRGRIQAYGTKHDFIDNPYPLLREFIDHSFVNKSDVL